MEFVKELLLSNNYWVLNKSVVSEFGVETAFILGVLAEAEKMLADKEGWFYQTSETLEELTGLSNHKQTLCINQLIEVGALCQQNKGMPRKRYFKIDYGTIQRLVFKNFKDLPLKNLNTSIQNFSNNKESNYKENNNKENNKENKNTLVCDDEFENFWLLYDKKVGKPICIKKWNKISKEDKELIFKNLPAYIKSTSDKKYRKNPETWLNQEGWNDELIERDKTTEINRDDNVIDMIMRSSGG